MREVSCRAFQYFEREALHHGVEPEAIFAGTGLDLAVLRDPGQRVDWDAWALACDRFMEHIGGPEAMRESGHRVIQLRVADRFRRLVAGVVSVEQVYGAAGRWFIPMLYRYAFTPPQGSEHRAGGVKRALRPRRWAAEAKAA